MKLSQSFIPFLHEISSNSDRIISHKLMLQAGLIQQVTKGIYCWLPLGYRVLQKVIKIIQEEQDKIGAIELKIPVLQPSQLWKESNRYQAYGKELLKFHDREGHELIYAPTNEELLCNLVKNNLKSYQELPKILYCIESKFRDEIRPRFGVMRSREFLMKDAYSFDLTESQALQSYYKLFTSYLRIFKRLELNIIPAKAQSGPIGGDLNHEFILLAERGESKIDYDPDILQALKKLDLTGSNYEEIFQHINAFHSEIKDVELENKLQSQTILDGTKDKQIFKGSALELGHIFYFGTKYSQPMNVTVTDQNNKQINLFMGSYGLGISRIIAALIEINHDERGIIWPMAVAPYQVGLVNLNPANLELTSTCEQIYQTLINQQIEVLYHDTVASVGSKFSTMDLLGIPYQIIIGENELKNQKLIVKDRKTSTKTLHPFTNIANYITEKIKSN